MVTGVQTCALPIYRQHRARDVHRPDDADCELAVDLPGGELLEEPRLEAGGVVDEHIDAAEALDRGRHGRPRAGHVDSSTRARRRSAPIGTAPPARAAILRSAAGRDPYDRELSLTFNRLDIAADPGMTLFTYAAGPGSRSEEGLKLLGSWAATDAS